jgi:hypothetical protein
MLAGTWRDHKACVGRTRTAAKVWPCEEQKCYMTYLPLRCLYLNYVIGVVSSFGCLHICLEERGSQVSLKTLAHFLLLFAVPIFSRVSIGLA